MYVVLIQTFRCKTYFDKSESVAMQQFSLFKTSFFCKTFGNNIKLAMKHDKIFLIDISFCVFLFQNKLFFSTSGLR